MAGCGASGVGRSRTPDCSSFEACCRGPLPTGFGCGGCRLGDTSPTHSARSCELALRAVGAARGRPGGGASCLVVGRPGSGALPPTDCSSFGACGRGQLLTGCGCGGCGRGDPSPTPLRALLRAGFARCGGGTRAPGGGHLLPWRGASGVERSPMPDRSSYGASRQGPLPKCCGCGGSGRGDPSPTRQLALLRAGFACCEGGMRATGEGVSCLCVGHPGSGALPLPTALLLVRAVGAHYPLAVGAGGRGRGDSSQTHSARSCELALHAVEEAQRHPAGGRTLRGCGASGVGRSPTSVSSSFGACGRGPIPTGCGCGGCGRGDPSPTHSPCSCKLALRAVGAARRRLGGGGTSCLGVRLPRSGAHPPPTARTLGRGSGAHYSLAVGAGGVGLVARLSLAPSPVPRFIVCCACFLGLRHPVAVVA